MIEMIPALPDNVLGFIAKGTVTADDYDTILEPAVATALESNEKVRLLYVLGADFTGYEGGAMWEDTKMGAKAKHFEKIAVVSDKDWVRHTVEVMGWLMPCEVKVFHVDHEAEASEWITA